MKRVRERRVVFAASTLIGDEIRNPAGEHLGDIEELMIDTENGRIAYAVVSFGGFLGLGDRLFAVPWNALRLSQGEKRFILDVEDETLETAPGFDEDDWPEMTDREWGTEIHRHYGSRPYWHL